MALGLLAGGSTGCGPGTPTAFRIYVYYDRAELDVRQVSVQVGFLPEGPGAPSVLPAEMQGPLDQGSSVGLVFDEADSGRAALVVLTALGPGGVPVGVQSLSLVTPAIGMIEDQFVGFGTSPPLPPPGQVGP